MTSPCNAFRDQILERSLELSRFRPRADSDIPVVEDAGALGTASFGGVELDAHLVTCAACAQLASRLTEQRSALGGLMRLEAPAELAGRVVAAGHAGYRQERIQAALRGLAHNVAPTTLDAALWSKGAATRRQDAAKLAPPPVLARLVAEELADPTKSLARRYAGRLGRLNAPEILRRRLDDGVLSARSHRSRRNRLINSLVVVLLVTITSVATFMVAQDDDVVASAPAFVIEKAESIADFDPLTRSLASGLTGGLFDLSERRSERKQ